MESPHRVAFGLLTLLMSCTGTNTGNPALQEPRFRLLGDDSFLILDANVEQCSTQRAPDPSKLSPSKDTLASRLGGGSAEFVVLMKEEVSLQSYPLPSDRQGIGEDNPLYQARATQIARSQGCTLEALADGGGNYTHSFLLINAFVAELTLDQAVALSELGDVRSVELSQSNEPPPTL